MGEIPTVEETLASLQESIKKGDFAVEHINIPEEEKPLWIKGKEDGEKYMREVYGMEKAVNDMNLERLRAVRPEDYVIQEYVSKAGIDTANQEQVDAYVMGFYSACEQGFPPLNH
jgi:hypothetical protein